MKEVEWGHAPPSTPALMVSLQVAVPLKIADLRHIPDDYRLQQAPNLAEILATHGDDLMYGGKSCVAAFGAVARALALLAFAPGGVSLWGILWCERHYPFGLSLKEPGMGICDACVREGR